MNNAVVENVIPATIAVESASQPNAGQKPEVREIPLEQIQVSEFCKRDVPEEHIDELAADIQKNGLLHFPPAVPKDGGGYVLPAGGCRMRAVKKLGWTSIPCQVIRAKPEEAPWIAWSENALRNTPTPVDEARFIALLMQKTGQTEEQIAERMKISQSGISERLGVLRLPQDVLNDVGFKSESPFKFTHAVALSQLMRTNRFSREIEIRQLRNKIVQIHLSTSETKSLVRLIAEGDCDRLPESLRPLLLNNAYMTSSMAEIYLHPEETILGEGDVQNKLRRLAKALPSKERERLVLHAVREQTSCERAKEKLLKTLERLLCAEDKAPTPNPIPDRLLTSMSECVQTLDQAQKQMSDLESSSQEELVRIRKAGAFLQDRLASFLQALSAAATKALASPKEPGQVTEQEVQNVADN